MRHDPKESRVSARNGNSPSQKAATQGRKGRCMNEQLRDDKTLHAPTLTSAEVRFSIVDEYILLRLDTADDQTWWRLSREKFIGLAQYLSDEARRMREQ